VGSSPPPLSQYLNAILSGLVRAAVLARAPLMCCSTSRNVVAIGCVSKQVGDFPPLGLDDLEEEALGSDDEI
jgi:hypothetical protein